MTEPVPGKRINISTLSRRSSHPPRNSGGRRLMNSRAFQNRDLGEPSLSTYSALRDPKPTPTPSLNRQSVQASDTDSHDTPASRLFSVKPGSRDRQRSTTHSTHSRCLGKRRKGTVVGQPTSALRGSNVTPQSLMKSTG